MSSAVVGSAQVTPRRADASEVLTGRILLTVPHMDDCVLGCGGTIAQAPDKANLHVVYVTDGARLPPSALSINGGPRISRELAVIREEEAKKAMGFLGVPQGNIHFLRLPEGRLLQPLPRLLEPLRALMADLRPNVVLAPFRYDRHVDHLALNKAATILCQQQASPPRLMEYFVYNRWRLLPRRDIRRYIDPRHLVAVDIDAVSTIKVAALKLFVSQTTRFYPWQARPVLDARLLAEVSQGEEMFLQWRPAFPGATVFAGARTRIRLVHRLEPTLKAAKDRLEVTLLGGRTSV